MSTDIRLRAHVKNGFNYAPMTATAGLTFIDSSVDDQQVCTLTVSQNSLTQTQIDNLSKAYAATEPHIESAGTTPNCVFLKKENNLSDVASASTVKTNMSMGNVDNTSDASKPVSTAMQTALNAKFNTPAGSTSQYLRGDGTLATFPTRSFSAANRSLNSAFQPSSTKDAMVSYSVDISTSVSLSGGQVGTVYLEYADDSGFTTNVIEIGRSVSGDTGTLVIGLTLDKTNTATLAGMVPIAKYVRLRTQNNTGTPTFTYRSGQEVLF